MDELIVDSFAGGGGASLGLTWALHRHPDIAINHDPHAILMHKANHPTTTHYTEDVWKVSPHIVTKGRPVGVLWSSPDCKHFSRAKGSKPVDKKIRSLAWTVVKWAAESKPKLLITENVAEYMGFGPLIPRWRCNVCNWKGIEKDLRVVRRQKQCPACRTTSLTVTQDMVPCPDRKGLNFKRFIGRLRNLGYNIEWRVLNASDFGAPTNRKRLFIIGRRDGLPIVWPAPTHGNPKRALAQGLKPWRTAAECIDWSIPCPSIFDRKKPLVEKTLRRIALGIKRYVLENPQPFIVDMQRENPAKPIDAPLGTITTQGNRFNLITPYMVRCNHGGEHFRGQPVTQPMCTLTSSRDAHGLMTPILAKCNPTQTHDPQAPSSPVIQSQHNNGSALSEQTTPRQQLPLFPQEQPGTTAAAFLHRYYGESIGQSIDHPSPAASQNGHSSLVTAYLAKHFGGMVGVGINTPLPTTTARGTQNQIVTANLIHMNHGDKQWSAVDEPLNTITAGGNHAFLVYSFLSSYLGNALGPSFCAPSPAGTEEPEAGLVTVMIQGEPYIIVDIGMRMLTPRELARAQGFPEDYKLTGSKTNQVAKIGNSVCPQMAEVLISHNYTAPVETASRQYPVDHTQHAA